MPEDPKGEATWQSHATWSELAASCHTVMCAAIEVMEVEAVVVVTAVVPMAC